MINKPPRIKKLQPKKIYRVHIHMGPHETSRHLMTVVDHCCVPQPRRRANGQRTLHAYASGAAISELSRKRRTVTVLADAAVEGAKAQRNVSKTDRFDGGRSGPGAVGTLV
jgi:hypothetical protein